MKAYLEERGIWEYATKESGSIESNDMVVCGSVGKRKLFGACKTSVEEDERKVIFLLVTNDIERRLEMEKLLKNVCRYS